MNVVHSITSPASKEDKAKIANEKLNKLASDFADSINRAEAELANNIGTLIENKVDEFTQTIIDQITNNRFEVITNIIINNPGLKGGKGDTGFSGTNGTNGDAGTCTEPPEGCGGECTFCPDGNGYEFLEVNAEFSGPLCVEDSGYFIAYRGKIEVAGVFSFVADIDGCCTYDGAASSDLVIYQGLCAANCVCTTPPFPSCGASTCPEDPTVRWHTIGCNDLSPCLSPSSSIREGWGGDMTGWGKARYTNPTNVLLYICANGSSYLVMDVTEELTQLVECYESDTGAIALDKWAPDCSELIGPEYYREIVTTSSVRLAITGSSEEPCSNGSGSVPGCIGAGSECTFSYAVAS